MAPNTVTLELLWEKLRGCENSLRYLSDVVIGAGSAVGGNRDYAIPLPADRSVAEDFALSFPDCCEHINCPPWCRLHTDEIADKAETVAKITSACSKIVASLMTEVGRTVPEFDAYTSEQPGTCWRNER